MRTTTLCDQIRNIFIELDLRLKSKLHANQLPTIVERRPTATPKLSRTSKFQSTPASKYLNSRRVRQPFLKLATPVPSHLGPRDHGMIQPASNVASGFCASHCDCSLAPSPDTWERKRKIRLRETERERRCFSITSESGWRRWVGWRFFIACTSKNRLPRDDTELPPQQSKWPRCYPVRGWEKLLWGGGYDVLARTVA